AGDGRGHVPSQATERRYSDLLGRRWLSALLAGDDHVWLQQHVFEHDVLFEEGVKHGVKHVAGHLLAFRDVVRTVHEHFRLDDRNEALFLAQPRVSRESVSICAYTRLAWPCAADANDGPPFCEAGTQLTI